MGNLPTITWPTEFEVGLVDNIRDAIGRDTVWYIVVATSGCTLCSLDPINNTATDPFCPVCSGEYWIETLSGVALKAHITWGYSELPNWQTGGTLDDGECRVQIKLTDENYNYVSSAKYVIVDNKKMEISKKILRGVRENNRIIVDLIEYEEED